MPLHTRATRIAIAIAERRGCERETCLVVKANPRGLYVVDVCCRVKRSLRDAGLSGILSPHSFHVTTITDLLEQRGVPIRGRAASGRARRPAHHVARRPPTEEEHIVERISI
jgi:hypothetical protein